MVGDAWSDCRLGHLKVHGALGENLQSRGHKAQLVGTGKAFHVLPQQGLDEQPQMRRAVLSKIVE